MEDKDEMEISGEFSLEGMREFSISEEGLERIKNLETFKEHLRSGKGFQDLLGFSSETMEKFYQKAHTLYCSQNYQAASEAFTFLTTLDSTVHNYWLGLGMSEHRLEEYHGALIAYAMAILTEPTNPLAYYHSAGCYKAVIDDENALVSIEKAISQCGDKEEYQSLKQQASAVRDALLKRKNS